MKGYMKALGYKKEKGKTFLLSLGLGPAPSPIPV
jgi:hypothetical protein